MKQYLEDLICDECSCALEHKDFYLRFSPDVIVCDNCSYKGLSKDNA